MHRWRFFIIEIVTDKNAETQIVQLCYRILFDSFVECPQEFYNHLKEEGAYADECELCRSDLCNKHVDGWTINDGKAERQPSIKTTSRKLHLRCLESNILFLVFAARNLTVSLPKYFKFVTPNSFDCFFLRWSDFAYDALEDDVLRLFFLFSAKIEILKTVAHPSVRPMQISRNIRSTGKQKTQRLNYLCENSAENLILSRNVAQFKKCRRWEWKKDCNDYLHVFCFSLGCKCFPSFVCYCSCLFFCVFSSGLFGEFTFSLASQKIVSFSLRSKPIGFNVLS